MRRNLLTFLTVISTLGLGAALGVGFSGTSGVLLWPATPQADAMAPTYAPRLREVAVEVAPVVRQAIASEESFTGDLLPRRVTRVMAEVDGVVQQIPQVGETFDVTIGGRRYAEQLGITYGQAVKKGDVLVQLDPRDFRIQLQMAEAKLAKARADLAKLKSWQRPEEVRRLEALRDEAVARLEQAGRDLARLESLVTSRTVTRAEYEQSAMEVATARAMVDSAEATLASARAGPTAEEVAVQQALVAQAEVEVQQAQRDVEKTSIRAPYDGIVTSINVEVGDRVSPGGDVVVELMDLSYLVAEIGVPESYVGAIDVHDQATVTAAGVEQAVPGVVVAINEKVDPATRTFRVRVAIDNTGGTFKAGQFATVQLPLGTADSESLVTPRESLVFVEGEPHVFVLEEERVHLRGVKPGLSSKGLVQLTGDIREGDRVVVEDPSLLSDGMQVKVETGASVNVADVAINADEPRS